MPTFDSSIANAYYTKKYGAINSINKEDLAWFPMIESPKVAYNESRITPKVVKAVLKKKSANAAPLIYIMAMEALKNADRMQRELKNKSQSRL